MATCDLNSVVKAVVDNGQDQFYSFGIELGMNPAQISSIIDGKPSNADKLRAIIDSKKAIVGEEDLFVELITACGRLPFPITGVVEDQMKLRGKNTFGSKLGKKTMSFL